jgi:dipeptidase
VYANQYLIENEWDLASVDLINYAKQQGWFNPDLGKSFSFRHSYGKDLDTPYNTLREQRMVSLLGSKVGHITIQDVINVTRDHYEGTEYSRYITIDKGTSQEPYLYPPHKSPYRTICVPRTQASMVCALRSDMPREIGNLMWLCLSSPCTSVYLPIYAGSSKAPKEYEMGGGKYDPISAWWAFDQLQRLVDNFVIDRKYVREIWDHFEQREFERQTEFEKVVLQVYERDCTLANELLSQYTYQCLSFALDIAKILVSQGLRKTFS